MILIIGGTSEGRQLAQYLSERGYKVVVSVTTPLGAQRLRHLLVETVMERFSEMSLLAFIRSRRITAVVDASHPFAEEISRLATGVCEATQVTYIRFDRPSLKLPQHSLVQEVTTWESAAAAACRLSGTAFLTVGVKPLVKLSDAGLMKKKRVIARVLPEEDSIKTCKQLGINEIVALAGVASEELNKALFRQFDAGMIMTKDSGESGGTTLKIKAALALNLPVVIVSRPKMTNKNQTTSFKDVIALIKGGKEYEGNNYIRSR